MTVEVMQSKPFVGILNPHQEDGVLWLQDRRRSVLADDVGLGKTATVLAHIGDLLDAGELAFRGRNPLFRVLWLTDTNLVDQAVSEINTFLPEATAFTIDHPGLKNTAKGRAVLSDVFGGKADFLVMGHEMAHSRHSWLDHFEPAMLVIDEASKLRGGGVVHKSITGISKRTPRVVSITATLIENHPMELWNILSATDLPDLWPKRVFESDFVTWREVQIDATGRTSREPFDWQTNCLADVREYLAENVLRRTADEVGLPLPVRVGEAVRWVALSGAQASAYDASEGEGRRKFKALEGAILDFSEGSPLVDDLLAELAVRGNDQAIVYSGRLDMMNAIADAFDRVGITFARIQGETSKSDRVAAVEAHRLGEVRVLLGTEVLERGLNLQHCRVLISIDSSWNPAREHQREGRICRIGSPHHSYEHLTLRPDTPLSKAQAGTLDRKIDVARQVGLA